MDNDLISRQGLIDFLAKIYAVKGFGWEEVHFSMNDMEMSIIMQPSAQPEIIHCKECKYGVQDEGKRWYCRGLGCQVGEADGSGFCADAERRTDGGLNQQAGSN